MARTAVPAVPRPRDAGEVREALPGSLAAAVLDALPDATAVVDEAGRIVAVNRAWSLFAMDNGGDATDNGVGASYLEVCDASAARDCQDARVVGAALRDVLAGRTSLAEWEYACPSPAVGRWFLLRITPLGPPGAGAVLSHVNITRRRMAEERLAHQAAHDPLTGLPNRRLLLRRLAPALRDQPVGVLVVDLDSFKPVNDTFGHLVGDELLGIVAARLSNAVRTGDTVARLGGDEFAIVAPGITERALAALRRRLQAAVAEPMRLQGATLTVQASIGSYRAAPGQTVRVALQRADEAMYAEKRRKAVR